MRRACEMLYFVNDYCEGAHPAILQKLLETNMEKLSGYGTETNGTIVVSDGNAIIASNAIRSIMPPVRSR